jgi:condensin subunit ScpB
VDSAEKNQLLGALEALLLVAAEPVPTAVLAQAISVTEAQADALLRELAAEYAGRHGGRIRGIEVREVGGGWRLYTNARYADIVAAHVVADESGKLSLPALETLAVIAYKQPVTRSQIASVRGVSVDSVVRTLQTRGLICEVGTTETNGAILYGTTPYFLEAMGINSLSELAPLAPYLPEASELDEVAKDMR